MAVQKSRKTPSTRGMRRSHDALTAKQIATDKVSGELHLHQGWLLPRQEGHRDQGRQGVQRRLMPVPQGAALDKTEPV